MKIILASASPRRKELLEQIGLEFEVKVSHVQERITAAEPGKMVEELSEQKARAVLETLGSEKDVLVIGADTIVAVGNSILGKPSGEKHAGEMLEGLSGNTHEVYTGVTVYYRTSEGVLSCKTFHEMTKVSFYPMSEGEISGYVATKDCMDKAGAYGIQGFCARYIRGIEGDYNNVVGLPVGRLYQEIKEWLE